MYPENGYLLMEEVGPPVKRNGWKETAAFVLFLLAVAVLVLGYFWFKTGRLPGAAVNAPARDSVAVNPSAPALPDPASFAFEAPTDGMSAVMDRLLAQEKNKASRLNASEAWKMQRGAVPPVRLENRSARAERLWAEALKMRLACFNDSGFLCTFYFDKGKRAFVSTALGDADLKRLFTTYSRRGQSVCMPTAGLADGVAGRFGVPAEKLRFTWLVPTDVDSAIIEAQFKEAAARGLNLAAVSEMAGFYDKRLNIRITEVRLKPDPDQPKPEGELK